MPAMIELEQLTKHYPGRSAPAVDSLDLTIAEGEIVILVGPSGCGKTTTLKMINRIIEPSSGIIRLQGEDVTRANPDHLRRRIGYVIQQVGLFPHQTIGRNITTVPRLLGWSQQRIDDRLDELMHLVGMDPGTYRDRYPKELSGGQRQRVGVARALAADPPVMLMDEPFGALDPISRERLQNEFLRLQEEIRKTIVFVTHDIDEAITMGDRIAILREGSTVAQYDTPETVLAAPADDFVREFIGSGAALKRLGLARVRDVELGQWPTSPIGSGREAALRALASSEHGSVLLLDDRRRPLRWVRADELEQPGSLERLGVEVRGTVEPTTTLAHALDAMVGSRVGAVVVVDGSGALLGTVDMRVIMAAVDTMRTDAHEQDREEVPSR
ncbi:ABC transporter ATP-binding protein [Pseudonocardia xinjiangensis]|uniref:Betaine/proline/choline family ABC transporter ATP-binding protein n=1 Tax=Pseudonocardia xinjiangensis TaxID=75289 RepID=A0ABX1R9I0_9PSEU|nr:ABC transporter ATP-binding protein [Pseudonocardia xinjiangensis]NMH77042.1 betaine/proline/choline family ABC transporter ATP-binding protein [Pseudonocardia xinjiangensis]